MDEVVDVWCAFTERWVAGFRVVERQPDGGVVVANAHSEPLPVPLPAAAVRPASRSVATAFQLAAPSRRSLAR
jgi:hypothetical protein